MHYYECDKGNISGIEFKDFILGFRQSTFLCTTLKCIEKFRIPFIKSGIPASNLGSSEARNPAACIHYKLRLFSTLFTTLTGRQVNALLYSGKALSV